jgi:hypothetical protein
LCDWASEPLKERAYERHESSQNSDHQRNMDTLTAQSRAEHEFKTQELELEHKLRTEEKVLEIDLKVRRFVKLKWLSQKFKNGKRERI